MKSLLVRREKAKQVREELISMEIEFYEERDGFHFLFIFPVPRDEIGLSGKWAYLVGEEVEEVETKEGTFKIDGSREVINLFAPKFEKRGLKVKMENPDNLIEIKRWGKKYLISVS
ncbi:MAG: hypothetical protein M1161_03825 [Candidatus Thermoplasmatota archaeon]|nr:hypothetical protein [Candidatus Thermoplasmatota archaeon]